MAATKKTAAKKTVAKKTAPRGAVKVKMITTVDSVPGKDTTVFFSDGTHAIVKSGTKLSDMLTSPDNVAPNLIKVTVSRGIITDAAPVDVDNPEA